MKIGNKFKVREMAGEHVIVMPGHYGVDMTRIVALNASSLYLWEALADREFTENDVIALLTTNYTVDEATARHDAGAWLSQLAECGILEK